MPINIPINLPAKQILESENIFVMDEKRAFHQDIRPLNIVILNLMPQKIKTETQLLRMLGNSPLQVYFTFLIPSTHTPKHTPRQHLEQFYTTFSSIRDRKFDGMIITGAPIEHLEYEEVSYWEELQEILDWSKTHVTSTLHICWGAQAGLYHHYGIRKVKLPKKTFGVFEHRIMEKNERLVRGFEEFYYVPHSRHTDINMDDLKAVSRLKVLSISDEAGVCLIASDEKQVFLTGHPEYDTDTLKEEYERDLARNMDIDPPVNYFKDGPDGAVPVNRWKAHATLLFMNWLNYYVYQETPYEWK
ncbi:homoserine O-acetyltransferase MetA [Bacillus haynesii]|uniref:homoserine O-acetyltransferase MetA n=1 Tax=Bacillus haynesii TaxID=1925021 RepID=UPI00227EEA36|nr:homoserine O-succinyltransferase [Bacillus haynesii]MCY7816759.1 homoserine O-succinyltransferase [Bacillus haynesii]MCY8243686.1 homoserine O-succinyltransferase [Bacillus haynesii]MCY8569687.1 homoserine O-succinyltransferase [Bacillus haynesii]MCY8662075.1 homoserine O-succinyltransferase [Bacillus haynesii]